jgi:hypothetical protein
VLINQSKDGVEYVENGRQMVSALNKYADEAGDATFARDSVRKAAGM